MTKRKVRIKSVPTKKKVLKKGGSFYTNNPHSNYDETNRSIHTSFPLAFRNEDYVKQGKVIHGEKIGKTIKEVPEDISNAELELGEYIWKANGEFYKVNGKKHSKGGTPIVAENGDFIFSSADVLKGEDLKFFYPQMKETDKRYKKGVSFSTLATKYNDLNDYIELLTNDNPFEQDTARLMIDTYNKGLATVAFAQEKNKGFKNGLPQRISEIIPELAGEEGATQPTEFKRGGEYNTKYPDGGEYSLDDLKVRRSAAVKAGRIGTIKDKDKFYAGIKDPAFREMVREYASMDGKQRTALTHDLYNSILEKEGRSSTEPLRFAGDQIGNTLKSFSNGIFGTSFEEGGLYKEGGYATPTQAGEIQKYQQEMKAAGFDIVADGVWGPNTQKASDIYGTRYNYADDISAIEPNTVAAYLTHKYNKPKADSNLKLRSTTTKKPTAPAGSVLRKTITKSKRGGEYKSKKYVAGGPIDDIPRDELISTIQSMGATDIISQLVSKYKSGEPINNLFNGIGYNEAEKQFLQDVAFEIEFGDEGKALGNSIFGKGYKHTPAAEITPETTIAPVAPAPNRTTYTPSELIEEATRNNVKPASKDAGKYAKLDALAVPAAAYNKSVAHIPRSAKGMTEEEAAQWLIDDRERFAKVESLFDEYWTELKRLGLDLETEPKDWLRTSSIPNREAFTPTKLIEEANKGVNAYDNISKLYQAHIPESPTRGKYPMPGVSPYSETQVPRDAPSDIVTPQNPEIIAPEYQSSTAEDGIPQEGITPWQGDSANKTNKSNYGVDQWKQFARELGFKGGSNKEFQEFLYNEDPAFKQIIDQAHSEDGKGMPSAGTMFDGKLGHRWDIIIDNINKATPATPATERAAKETPDPYQGPEVGDGTARDGKPKTGYLPADMLNIAGAVGTTPYYTPAPTRERVNPRYVENRDESGQFAINQISNQAYRTGQQLEGTVRNPAARAALMSSILGQSSEAISSTAGQVNARNQASSEQVSAQNANIYNQFQGINANFDSQYDRDTASYYDFKGQQRDNYIKNVGNPVKNAMMNNFSMNQLNEMNQNFLYNSDGSLTFIPNNNMSFAAGAGSTTTDKQAIDKWKRDNPGVDLTDNQILVRLGSTKASMPRTVKRR